MFASRFRRPLGVLAAATILAAPSPVSDPIGVFALIDRVVVEPDANNPQTIQLWGVFALTPGVPGDAYQPAGRGYLYYNVNGRNERATLAEWHDLAAVAGTGRPIGFGGRYEKVGRVRRATEAPNDPDTYPLGFGLVKALTAGFRPGVENELVHVPNPTTPADGGRARAGQVQLAVPTLPDLAVQYVFEITGPDGQRETSKPMPGTKGSTEWTPQLRLRSGQSYTWRVWVVKGDWSGQPASATFRAL